MKLKAYAKINLILNVLGKRPDGYHEVEMLMQAISLCDVVEVASEENHVLGPQDFEYGQKDLAYKAAMLAAEAFKPELICHALGEDGLELAPGVAGVRVSIEKHIPAAAGLAGGSADAAAVLIGLASMWDIFHNPSEATAQKPEEHQLNSVKEILPDALLYALLPLAAQLGSDVPFCLAAQLGRPAAIARGTGTLLEFVPPTDCAVTLYNMAADGNLMELRPDELNNDSSAQGSLTIPNKTAAVYAELREEDCRPRYDIAAFLAAETLEEKRSFMGNHLQAPAERLFAQHPKVSATKEPMLCGAGPTYFTISETGPYCTVL